MDTKSFPIIRTGIGQDSHRFLSSDISKPCILGGVIFENAPGLKADSDGDVIYHAICNAITSLTGVLILGGVADELCLKDGITDSQAYLEAAMKTLERQTITHLAITVEGKKPILRPKLLQVREKIASVMNLQVNQVGLTGTSGEGLTDFGCGEGIQCFCILTTIEYC